MHSSEVLRHKKNPKHGERCRMAQVRLLLF